MVYIYDSIVSFHILVIISSIILYIILSKIIGKKEKKTFNKKAFFYTLVLPIVMYSYRNNYMEVSTGNSGNISNIGNTSDTGISRGTTDSSTIIEKLYPIDSSDSI